jgi:hypothetical protein
MKNILHNSLVSLLLRKRALGEIAWDLKKINRGDFIRRISGTSQREGHPRYFVTFFCPSFMPFDKQLVIIDFAIDNGDKDNNNR